MLAPRPRQLIEAVNSGMVYGREPGWWNIISVGQEPAGLVLPVLFAGCARDGLDEATLFHIGVVADQRRRGLGHLLLGKATDTLLSHGVWRIYCDTATREHRDDPPVRARMAGDGCCERGRSLNTSPRDRTRCPVLCPPRRPDRAARRESRGHKASWSSQLPTVG